MKINTNKNILNVLLIILLILIPLSLNFYLRSEPNNLPLMDEFAQQQVLNFYSQQITSEVNKKFAYLPEQQRQRLINEQLNKLLSDSSDEINKQIKQTSDMLKSRYKDDNNDTYLLAIDPYLQYYYTENYVNTGTYGDKIIDGEPVVTLRGGRFYRHDSFRFHPWLMSKWYKFLSMFSHITIMHAVFLFPLFWMSLSVIFAFFLGKK